ncbi:MAG TPA: Gfo/Idh/MocA family oxidoreductase, partial [Candidatus Eisenbacteria bacterium]|nr:Gfo/Idh/MocA family oxidoreductase [Candidatus Eisenbacteria bacterium]
AAVADQDPAVAAAAVSTVPGAKAFSSITELLRCGLDGVVIATPTALHAEQALAALAAGAAVFCQKPLARSAAETRRVVETARANDLLLGVDMSYRFVRGMTALKRAADDGAIGRIYAADLVFHNAYGPDKAWYYDRVLAGGGCVIDLGIHLIDLSLWMLDFPKIENVSSRLFERGQAVHAKTGALEDYAVARIDVQTGATINLSCSWRLPAGQDAVIGASFYGTDGGLSLQNVAGSFYDFRAARFRGTSRVVLAEPPDPWGGRAATSWAKRLAENGRYDPEVEKSIAVAEVIDAIYNA